MYADWQQHSYQQHGEEGADPRGHAQADFPSGCTRYARPRGMN